MSGRTKCPDLTQESMHSPSLFTRGSVFADSAISVGTSTPKTMPADDHLEMESLSSEASEPTLSERLSNLAAVAFAVEENGAMGQKREVEILKALKAIEECIEDRVRPGQEQEESQAEVAAKGGSDVEDGLEEIQLHEIHASLVATVASMRQRQQEQRHLHQFTIQKLEAVAQTCLVQQKQLNDTHHEVQELRGENQILGQENDILRSQVADLDALKVHLADLESQATQKEFAVHAMTSAVAGLEGWINNSPHADPCRTQSAGQTPRKGRIVVRGQGRFRGRYFVDDMDGEVVLNAQDTGSTATDLHEGVKSWLKGFRDVEEGLHTASPPRVIRSKTRSDFMSADDDWGDFETVSGA